MQYEWTIHNLVDWLCWAVQNQFLDVWFDIVEIKVRKSSVFTTVQNHYYSSRHENVSVTVERRRMAIYQ